MRQLLIRSAIVLLGVPIAVAFAAAIALSTHSGQAGLLRLVSYVASSDDGRIAFGDLTGSLFGEGGIDSIVLSDAKGVWLKAERLAFAWSPSQLVSGRLAIANLELDRVTLLRKPESTGAAEPVGVKSRGSMPEIPVKAAIGAIEIRTIHITEAVAGETLDLRLTGSAQIENMDTPASAHINVLRIDKSPARLEARLAIVPAAGSIELSVDGHEDAGGIVARLIGLPSLAPVSLKVNGRGTLDAWAAQLAVSSGPEPFVAGNLELASTGTDTHRLVTTVAGYIETLLPPDAAQLFRGRTELQLAADLSGLANGVLEAVSNARLAVSSDTLLVESTGGADIADHHLYGRAEGRLGLDPAHPLKFLAGTPDEVVVARATFSATLPEARDVRQLTGSLKIEELDHTLFASKSLAVSLAAVQPHPAVGGALQLEDIAIDAVVHGVDEDRPIGAAFGAEPRAVVRASYDGDVVTVGLLELRTAAATTNFIGTVSGPRVAGTVRLDADDLARLTPIAGRTIQGRARADITIDADLRNRALEADFEAGSTALGFGIEAADRLLGPQTTYRGHLARTSDGKLVAQNVSVANPLLQASLTGQLDADVPTLTATATIAALDAVDPSLSGKARVDLSVEGPPTDLRSALHLSGKDVSLNGRPIENPSLRFAGQGPLSHHTGAIEFTARLDGESANGSARIGFSDTGRLSVAHLNFDIAGAQLGGEFSIDNSQPPTGELAVDAANLARLGKTIGTQLAGRLTGRVEMSGTEGVARIDVKADNIFAGGLRIGRMSAQGEVANYSQAPVGALVMRVGRIANGETAIDDLKIDARLDGGKARYSVTGGLKGGIIDIAGTLHQKDGAHHIEVQSASYLSRGHVPAIRLAGPAHASYRDGQLSLAETRIGIGDGSLTFSGSADATSVDARVALSNIPAAIVSLAAPDLGVAGTVDGQATVRGEPSAPDIDARLSATAVSTRDTRANNLPGLNAAATLKARAGKADVGVRTTGPDGLDLALQGTIGLKGTQPLALDGKGTVPLSLANLFLADRAMPIQGAANVQAQVSGTASSPRVEGRIAINGASARDPKIGLDLSTIDADVDFTNTAVTVRRAVAVSKQGGDVRAGGSVQLATAAEPFANLSVIFTRFKFGNQDPVAAELDGRVTVTGPMSTLVARGNIDINRMDITVPNQLPRSVAALDIRHINAPPHLTQATPRPATATGNRPTPREPGPALHLDVHAADRIFVRGRGLDAQLGGDVKIRGSAAEPFTDGRFTMSRGRLSIIGRQLDFSRGNIVFTGSPEPSLDMEARADADGTTVTVTVTGKASKPQFQFSSTPPLPEDEIVSLLLFNKKLAKLSPSQVIQLAGEIDKIGGLSSGPSTLDQLKSSVGIDVLDFSTDAKGNAQASAGSFVNEQTYVGVKQGTSLSTGSIVIDHNFTKHLKARGEVGTSGDSKLGLGFEWEY